MTDRPERRPWLTLAGGLALALCGWAFGAVPLLVAGLSLALTAPAALLAVELTLRPVRATRHFATERIVEGEALPVRIELRRGRLGPRQILLIDPLVGSPRRLQLARGERRVSYELEAQPQGIGRWSIPPLSVRVTDPLGLTSRGRAGDPGPPAILVLPGTEPVLWPARLPGIGDAGDQHAGGTDPPAALEVDGVRPYRPGTPASRIHWASLARGAGLMERRLRADEEDLPLVVLLPLAGAAAADVDAALRGCASAVLSLAMRRGCRLALPGQPTLTVRGRSEAWNRAHEAIALSREQSDATLPPLSPAPLTILVGALARPVPVTGRTILLLPRSLWPVGAPAPTVAFSGCLGAEDPHGRTVAA